MKFSYTRAADFRDAQIILDTASRFVCEDTSRVALECNCGKDHISDAALRARRDPTRTLDLRRSFIRALERRWRKVASLITDAIARQDIFGLTGANVHALQYISMSSGRVNAFQHWVDAALSDTILGMDREQWISSYLHEAYRRGWKVAASQVGRLATIQEDRADILVKLTISELQGVIEAFSQRAVRVFSEGLLSHLPPAKIARSLRQAVDAIGIVRSRATVQVMIVRANNEAALDYFEMIGMKNVSVLPETIPSPGRVHAIRDAKRASRRNAKRKRPREMVEVLTAGDDDVCPICEDIAAGNPYSIIEARGLIPAHPNCRCAFVPAEDMRFAHGDARTVMDLFRMVDAKQDLIRVMGEQKFIEVQDAAFEEIAYAYRVVSKTSDLRLGSTFDLEGEAKLVRDVELPLKTGVLWEVDITDVYAEADANSVYLPDGAQFELTHFDADRNVWSVKARRLDDDDEGRMA